MRKTDKKIDNRLRQALTEVCNIALDQYDGFQWLTHFVDYDDFPDSLSVLCIYDTNAELENTDRDGLRLLVKEKLASMGIPVKDMRQRIHFDTEESCSRDHHGKWHERLR